MKIIVERKKWSIKECDNKLLGADGKYCILGFFGKALGIEDKDLFDKWSLVEFKKDYSVLEWLNKPVTWKKQEHSNQGLLMYLNDDPYVKNREMEIKKFLKMAKIEVEFK